MDISLNSSTEILDISFERGDFRITTNSKRDRVISILRAVPNDFKLGHESLKVLHQHLLGILLDTGPHAQRKGSK